MWDIPSRCYPESVPRIKCHHQSPVSSPIALMFIVDPELLNKLVKLVKLIITICKLSRPYSGICSAMLNIIVSLNISCMYNCGATKQKQSLGYTQLAIKLWDLPHRMMIVVPWVGPFWQYFILVPCRLKYHWGGWVVKNDDRY